jgi:hypothetical protein
MTFYEPLGENHYRATEHTVGPWDPGSQHGGPPAALLARAIEVTSPSWPATVARMSVDILSPIPVSDVLVRSRLLRPGRSVELVEAELEALGRTVMRAQAWRIRRADLQLPPNEQIFDPVPVFPVAESPLRPAWGGGYLDAMEWRHIAGDWVDAGPATIWGRMRYQLLPDEEPTGLQRVMVLSDSGNGVSSVLPLDQWLFINTDLTVHLEAIPSGEWICLDARTRIDRLGFGCVTSRLFDRERLVGHGAQTLYVATR